MPFEYGAKGDGAIDCIHMVYRVLEEYEIPKPAFNEDWYNQGPGEYLRDLLRWGERLPQERLNGSLYNGDVLWMPGNGPIFAAIWQTGVLHINPRLNRVHWLPQTVFQELQGFRYSPMRGS